MSRDPLCVYTAGSVEEADIVSAWLAEHDIEATVPDRHAIGATTFGLPAIVPRGVEVCVTEPGAVERALGLLKNHAEALASKLPSTDENRTIPVVCESCHEWVSFSPAQAGSVAECLHCRKYLDVPYPDAEM